MLFCRRRTVWVPCALALLVSGSAWADSINLGTAGPGNYAVLGLGGGDTHSATNVALNSGTTTGNIGIASSTSTASTLHYDNPGTLIGNVYLETNATLANTAVLHGSVYTGNSTSQVSGSTDAAHITGGVHVSNTTNATLNQAVTDAEHYASTYATLACTLCSTTTVNYNDNTTHTITGTNGTNVVDLTDLKLGGDNTKLLLTASGSAAQFILNVSGTFDLSGGDIILGGSLTPDEVLINYIGTNDLHTSGPEADIFGIILAEKANIGFSNAHITGEVISGGTSVQIVSGSYVTVPTVPVPTPEPASLTLLGSGLLLAFRARKRRAA